MVCNIGAMDIKVAGTSLWLDLRDERGEPFSVRVEDLWSEDAMNPGRPFLTADSLAGAMRPGGRRVDLIAVRDQDPATLPHDPAEAHLGKRVISCWASHSPDDWYQGGEHAPGCPDRPAVGS